MWGQKRKRGEKDNKHHPNFSSAMPLDRIKPEQSIVGKHVSDLAMTPFIDIHLCLHL